MTKKNNYDQCKIVISGAELVELKRHGHEIPGCPGLDRRIQKYNGEKPFTLTYEELGWLASVLDAVLNDPKVYRTYHRRAPPVRVGYPTSGTPSFRDLTSSATSTEPR